MDEIDDVSILYAEDDALIAVEAEESLRNAGFTVHLVTEGSAALAAVEDCATSIKALVMDINLGKGATGWEIAHRARELNPHLPVVYTSGGHEDDWASKGVPESLYISKPFVGAQVVVAVAGLINAASSHPPQP